MSNRTNELFMEMCSAVLAGILIGVSIGIVLVMVIGI